MLRKSRCATEECLSCYGVSLLLLLAGFCVCGCFLHRNASAQLDDAEVAPNAFVLAVDGGRTGRVIVAEPVRIGGASWCAEAGLEQQMSHRCRTVKQKLSHQMRRASRVVLDLRKKRSR